jgi:hypothetical protein
MRCRDYLAWIGIIPGLWLLFFLSSCTGSSDSTPTPGPTSAISLSSPNSSGFITITGVAGATPGEGIISANNRTGLGAAVARVNLESDEQHRIKSASADSECPTLASAPTKADGSFAVSLCAGVGETIKLNFTAAGGTPVSLGEFKVPSSRSLSVYNGNPCSSGQRQLDVTNNASQAVWVSGGGGALRSVCVINNGASSCLAPANTIDGTTGSCQCGDTVGSLACPGTANPLGVGTNGGLNCACSQNSDCGPGAGCNTNTGLCYFTLPAPTQFSNFTASSPWNWELPSNGDLATFCLNQAEVTFQPSPSPSATPTSIAIPSAVWWSGGVGARTGCQTDGTSCLTGDCNTNVSGSPVPNSDCPVGVGGAQPATIAEFTLQSAATDFYDITVINGANIGETMGPIPTATATPGTVTPSYWCTTPGGDCSFAFGQYLTNVPLPSPTPAAGTNYAALMALSAQPCTVGSGNPAAGQPPTGCPSFVDPDNIAYSCSGNPSALNGVCYKACTGNTDCPNNLQCLPAGDGNSYCQCSTDSDCASGQTCGTQLVPGLGGSPPLSPQVYIQQCGTFQGWWTVDDLCANADNIIYYNGGVAFDCGGTITDGDGNDSNIASLLGCNGASSNSQAGNPANEASCYNASANPTDGCCGCATDSSNALSADWPTATGACANNNATWASTVQPWLANLKQACPTAYSYPYDDFTSTFQCQAVGSTNLLGYTVTFTELPTPMPTPTPTP